MSYHLQVYARYSSSLKVSSNTDLGSAPVAKANCNCIRLFWLLTKPELITPASFGSLDGAIMPTLIRTWRTIGIPLAIVEVMAASIPRPPLGPSSERVACQSEICVYLKRVSIRYHLLARTIPLTSPYFTIDSKIRGSVSW